jgi:hypothetical protein
VKLKYELCITDDSKFVAAKFETALFEIFLLKKAFGPVIPDICLMRASQFSPNLYKCDCIGKLRVPVLFVSLCHYTKPGLELVFDLLHICQSRGQREPKGGPVVKLF